VGSGVLTAPRVACNDRFIISRTWSGALGTARPNFPKLKNIQPLAFEKVAATFPVMEEKATILLVDDSEEDVYLFQRALKSAGQDFNVHVAHNGLEAIQYLSRACEAQAADAVPMPKFILTDNRMPILTGRDLLRWIKEHPRCRVIPSVILGGSDSPDDVKESYDLGAHSYFVKPNSHAELLELVKMIFCYWAQAKVPSPPAGPP
jgi:CheY-like chemotaxis protein